MSGADWLPPPRDPRLAEGEVHVWHATKADAAPWRTGLYQALDADERARAARYRFEVDRERYIIGRGLLRVVLGRYLGERPAAVRFAYSKHGKPELCGVRSGEALCFNASHSREVDLIAVTRGRPIGVDVEYVRRDLDYERIARDFFSAREREALAALPEAARAEAFFACWTRKEAYVKALGEGLSIPLDEFDVSLDPGEPAALLRVAGRPEEAFSWTMRALDPGPGYMGALVARGPVSGLRLWRWPEQMTRQSKEVDAE